MKGSWIAIALATSLCALVAMGITRSVRAQSAPALDESAARIADAAQRIAVAVERPFPSGWLDGFLCGRAGEECRPFPSGWQPTAEFTAYSWPDGRTLWVSGAVAVLPPARVTRP